MVKKISLDPIAKVKAQQNRLHKRYGGDSAVPPYEKEVDSPEDIGRDYDVDPKTGKRLYWYFSATVHKKGMLGRALSGWYKTEVAAMDKAEELNAVDPEFFTYTTKDTNRARKIFALEEAERRKNLEAGMGRVAHEKTLARDEAKRKKRFGLL